MRRRGGVRRPVAAIAALGFAAAALAQPPPGAHPADPASRLAGEAEEGYARVLAPRPFDFPSDHGSHPAYRSEWWYFTGNLETAHGRRFGFQLTFFRFALAPAAPARESRWATRQAWMAHLAVTDVRAGVFHPFERFARGALGLAGASADPFRVWLEDWAVRADAPGTPFPLRLAAAAPDGTALDLRLDAVKPLVAQGEAGMSRKSGRPGNASRYYSYTRLAARGEVRLGGETHAVAGLAWLDREWGTSALGPEHAGWDWFALQLSDGRDLMFYRLRRVDGGDDPFSAGVVVDANGRGETLASGDVEIEVLGRWTSPRAGASYPAAWRVRVPRARIDLEIAPLVADQEHRGALRYWEGAVGARGRSEARAVTGHGYVELVGYSGRGE